MLGQAARAGKTKPRPAEAKHGREKGERARDGVGRERDGEQAQDIAGERTRRGWSGAREDVGDEEKS